MARKDNIMTFFKLSLIEQLSRYDDDAFAALANKGLLRRAYKDLEQQTVTILEETETSLAVRLNDTTITFSSTTLQSAKCSCKAASICQHILSAAIALKRSNTAHTSPVNTNQSGDASPLTTISSVEKDTINQNNVKEPSEHIRDLHDSLAAFSMADLVKYCGKSGYSWAWQFVNDLDFEKDTSISINQYIIVCIRHPKTTFRYMGGPLDNFVTDVDLKDIKKYCAAAVLIYKKANGFDLERPVESEKTLKMQLDLGKDFASGGNDDLTQLNSRIRLLGTIKSTLQECIKLGLSHLSESIQERFVTLAVWSTGAELFRISLLLRRIADHIEQLLDRTGGADERRLYDELAIAYALTESIASYADKEKIPSSLTGIARRRYEAAGAMELIPLSAFPWRTSSGYTGFTLLMWSIDDKSFCVYTDARPEDRLRGFNPALCYTTGVWNISPISSCIGHKITLSGAMISSDGRISSSETVSGICGDLLDSSELIDSLNVYDSWESLYKDQIRDSLSMLSFSDPMKNYTVIRPSKIGKSSFDKINQVFTCSVEDANGCKLNFELQYTSINAAAIEYLESILSRLQARTVFVGKLVYKGNIIVFEPLSIIRDKSRNTNDVIECVYFDSTCVRIPKYQKTKSSAHKAVSSVSNEFESFSPIPQMTELSHLLQNTAEHGIPDDTLSSGYQKIEIACQKVSGYGFPGFMSIVKNDFNASTLLKLRYTILQLEKIASSRGSISNS